MLFLALVLIIGGRTLSYVWASTNNFVLLTGPYSFRDCLAHLVLQQLRFW